MTTELYVEILRKVVELAPGLSLSIKTAMTDFEAAEIAAVSTVFPHVDLSGCLFHYQMVNILANLFS